MANRDGVNKILFLWLTIFSLASLLWSCSDSVDQYQFELLTSDQTNLKFNNKLIQTKDDNIMTYLYFFNGGGVGAGDFNNDGLIDLYFAGNMVSNKLFLNQGGLKFKDVTPESGTAGSPGWTTGVSIVDINNDGMLDIYINQVGGFKRFTGKNQLLVCKGITAGIPTYEDQASAYGLEVIGFSTQAAFFDYDLDGDLDMYQLNHSVHENGTFGERSSFESKSHPTAGDKLFRNEAGKFCDVTESAGISSTVIGYGLGIATGDINNDGWPDLYVSNDFHENDYLYINQHDGTFKELLNEQMTHTSRFSMGVDIGDINNDAQSDIISLDMQPYDPLVLKSSLGEDDYSAFTFKLGYGYNVQFARNNLQLNNGDGSFSEIGMYSNIFATDWSWASLFLDINNDGRRDVFISNGIPARMNDIDYVNFRTGDEDHQWKTKANMMEMEDLEIIERIPSIKFPNQIFTGHTDLVFRNLKDSIRGDLNSYSNGATYADLDNDGDLEVITNNINDDAFIYKNLTVERKLMKQNFIAFEFQGPPENRGAIGARVLIRKGNEIINYENFPVRGFQSSVAPGIHAGIGDTTGVDSVVVIWPDQTYQRIDPVYNRKIKLMWSKGLPKFNFVLLQKQPQLRFTDITKHAGLLFQHKENKFIEFDRERLIPFMVSTEGPAVAVGDINGDGLEDVFFGGAKRERCAVYLQQKDGKFVNLTSQLLLNDSIFEDVGATLIDIDQDKDLDLAVASGGNEYWGDSQYLKQRVYLNDGSGQFVKRYEFPNAFATASCIIPTDFNADGRVDFFIGGRATPKSYGVVPRSYLFENIGSGEFRDVTSSRAPALTSFGMITDAQWVDIDNDKDVDLLVAVEWGTIAVGINSGGKFKFQSLSSDHGLWNFVLPYDYDGDGDIDVIAGNRGRNMKFKPSVDEPVRMYVNDFDDNGQVEQILTYYVEGRELPFATHAEITKQIPAVKKKFLYAKNFAAANLEELFGKDKLSSSNVFQFTTVDNAFFENTGDESLSFTVNPLPMHFQLSSLRAGAIVKNSTSTRSTQVLTGGNFYENNIEMGRHNADYGSVLAVDQDGHLTSAIDGNLHVQGQIRHIVPIRIQGKECYLLVRNNDSCVVLDPLVTDDTLAIKK